MHIGNFGLHFSSSKVEVWSLSSYSKPYPFFLLSKFMSCECIVIAAKALAISTSIFMHSHTFSYIYKYISYCIVSRLNMIYQRICRAVHIFMTICWTPHTRTRTHFSIDKTTTTAIHKDQHEQQIKTWHSA